MGLCHETQSSPGKSGISNEVGRCQEGSSSFFASLNLFLSPPGTPVRTRSSAPSLDQSFFPRQSRSCPPYSLRPVSLASFGAAYQPSLRSGWTMMTYANSLPRREAGSLTNRPVTIRTIADFRHPRTGSTALLLSTTTELFVIDLVPQHDPQTNAQLARYRHARFP